MMKEALSMVLDGAAAIDFAPDMLVVRDIDVADPANVGHVSVFKDNAWCLHPASGKPTDRSGASFRNSPEQFKMALKRLVWVALNLGTPLETLERPTTAAKLIKPGTVSTYFTGGWQPFFRWLAGRKIKSMDEVDDVVLNALRGARGGARPQTSDEACATARGHLDVAVRALPAAGGPDRHAAMGSR